MSAGVRRDIERIARQFDELGSLCDVAQVRVERISRWSVGQHLHHLMKSDRAIFRFFPAPDEGPLQPVTTVGRIVLWSGWIPRGKGKAPAATRPDSPEPDSQGPDSPGPHSLEPDALAAEVETVRSLFGRAVEVPEVLLEPQAIAKHPVFGGLNRAQWLRFVAVHHHHHAKIVRDVLRAVRS